MDRLDRHFPTKMSMNTLKLTLETDGGGDDDDVHFEFV